MQILTKHALLSASSAHRWLVCTAAPHFEENFPDGASVYAEEGTLAHSICELHARKKFTAMSTRKFNANLKKLQEHPLYQDEMLKTAEVYVEYLTEKAVGFDAAPHVAFEVRVDLAEYIPEGYGACDCVMVGGDTLHITDYKHGKGVPVSAIGNPQTRLYALGALKLYRPIYGDQIKKASMGICQPRLSDTASEEVFTTPELLEWGDAVKPIAQEAYNGPGTFRPGDHCRFCKGKEVCRARAAYFAGFEQYADAALPGQALPGDSPILSNAEVADLLNRAEGLAAWYKDLQDYAAGALLAGDEIPGWKLVEGRSNRAFSDVDAAIQTLISAGYDEAVIFDRKPKTLSELEKMLGKKTFAELLSGYVVKPKGKPTLALKTDKREAFVPGPAEFEGVGNG